MEREAIPLEIDSSVDLLRLAQEVQESGEPRLLTHNGEQLVIVAPVKSRVRRRKTGLVKQGDPLFSIIGIGDSGVPGGYSERKHELLARAVREHSGQ